VAPIPRSLSPDEIQSRRRQIKETDVHTIRQCLLCIACVAACPAGRLLADQPGSGDARRADKIVYVEDLVYGRVHGAGLLADVAYPEGQKSLPVILSVHGGRWKAGHRRDASAIDVKQWAGLGFFAMSIDYRLVGCTPAPACYQDVQCAIRFVHANAEKYSIDVQRIFLIGQSAGGHLVALAATLGDGPFPRTGGWEKASNDVRAVISVAANYELTTLSWGDIWTPAGVDLIAARKQASPVNHVSKDSKPLLILHSDNDQSVPIDNALLMVDALRKANAQFTFERYPKMGHMGINEEVIKQALAFIKKQSERK
jgi:acetyl esterase/lipase